MRTWVAIAVGAAVGAVVAVAAVGVLLVVTDTQEPVSTAAQPPTKLTSRDCLEIIPDSVFETLGWRAQPAIEDAGRCSKLSDEGFVTVGDRPIAASSSERPAAAEKEFDQQCQGLYDGSGELPVRDPDWLPEGTTACARLLPANDKGNAALFFLTEQDEVVQIRLGALAPTPEDRLTAAFATLVEAADRRW